jgi:SAM-dependent methyltransferase
MRMRDLAAYVHEYDRLPFEATQAAVRRRFVLERIALLRPSRLLEVGCGRLPLFVDLPGVACTVVEPAPSFAAEARARAAGGSGLVHVHEGFLDTLEPAQPACDVLVVACLLHEVDDPQELLAQVRRHCGPDTTVHVNVPNALSLHRLLAVAMGLIGSVTETSATQQRMQQRGIYDLARLDRELALAGFEPTAQGSYFIKPFTHAQMQRLVDDGFLDAALLHGLEGLARFLPENGSEIFMEARVRP